LAEQITGDPEQYNCINQGSADWRVYPRWWTPSESSEQWQM